jgi:hypothetical protein
MDGVGEGGHASLGGRAMNQILADRELHDLIERLENAHDAASAMWPAKPTWEDFHDLRESAVDALAAAADYLVQLREARHSNQIGHAFKELRDDVARRAARIRRQSHDDRST